MRNFRVYVLLAAACILSLLLAAPACVKVKLPEQKPPSAAVSDATLADSVDSEGKPVNASNTFLVNAEVIYLCARLNNAPANTQVLVKLTYLGGEASSLANTTMYNNTKSGQGTGYLAFAMKPPSGGFPQGDYSVFVSANGQEVTTTPFKVQNLSAQKGWPRINKFTVAPDSVPQGTPVTLSWDITDATRITLQPEIGTIPAVGTRSVTPNVTTTYQIIASNEAGATKREVTVNVTAPLAGLTDLTVTDLWLEGLMVYYKVKNTGKIDSPPCYTNLWVDNMFPPLGGSSFVDVLKPGQEKTLVFSSYQWPYGGSDVEDTGSSGWDQCVSGKGSGSGFVDPSCLQHVVKVCADARDEARESSETNNCFSKIWGFLFDYNLQPSAHLASWRNSSGEQPVQGVEGARTGAFIKMSDGGLEMVPDQVPQGWVQGYWGYYYVDRESGRTYTAAVKVPAKLKFVARVGLASSASANQGVTFKLGIRDLSDQTNYFPGKTMKTPGVFETMEIDLKDYVDQKVFFILRVEAVGSPQNSFAVWKEARLVQME